MTTTAAHAGFIADICEHPEDDSIRLIYADWLEERGDPRVVRHERIEVERLKQEEARLRREAKARVEELLKGKSLNDPNAEIARHFPYGGKIKRIHVNADQLKALNAGELGVVQQNGRYLLVTAALLAEAESIFPACVALKVDPGAPAEEDPYADPQYQVPDDLVW